MQHVAQPTALPATREAAAAAITAPAVVAKQKIDPQMLALPFVIVAGLLIVVTWVVTFLFIVGGCQYMVNAWKFIGL